ncbi:MAG: (2Fe-2S)-binding protein [Planctomycetota bacterium]|jgi:carbon-monoxide dehydrogenase small subunit
MNAERVTRKFRVNGEEEEVRFLPHKTLLEVLREDMNLTGTKHGCELGECGTCTVLLDGEPQLSCLTLALECEGVEITTIEGLARGNDPHPLQKRFAELGASQCGYCSSGFLLTAKSLLDREPEPDRNTLKDELSGNLCRCTGYLQIFEAIEAAAADVRKEGASR